jgi:hypothetical protein
MSFSASDTDVRREFVLFILANFVGLIVLPNSHFFPVCSNFVIVLFGESAANAKFLADGFEQILIDRLASLTEFFHAIPHFSSFFQSASHSAYLRSLMGTENFIQ